MSLQGLDQASLAQICHLVDARYIAHLLCSGSAPLIAKLRHSVRNFVFKNETAKWPHKSLFEFILQFKQLPRTFSFRSDRFYGIDDPESGTATDWTIWPAFELQSFSYCIGGAKHAMPNFGLFPALHTLELEGVSLKPKHSSFFPQTLTSLRIDDMPQKTGRYKRLLEFLPPNLTQLRCKGSIVLDEDSPKIDLSHLPLVDVCLSIYPNVEIDTEWTFLPPTVKILEVKFSDNATCSPPANTSFKQLFPNLTLLETKTSFLFPVANPEQAHIEFPQSLTSLDLISSYYDRDTGQLFERLAQKRIAEENGPRILHLGNVVDASTRFRYFPCLETYDLSDISSWVNIDDRIVNDAYPFSWNISGESLSRANESYMDLIFNFQRVKELKIHFLPLPSQLQRFPKTLTKLYVQLCLERHAPCPPGSPVDPSSAQESLLFEPSDWPPMLDTLHVLINHSDEAPSDEAKIEPVPSFNFSGLPTTLTHLQLRMDRTHVAQKFRHLKSVHQQSPFFRGSLAHLTRLQTLSLSLNGRDYRKAIDSRLDLPASLTDVNRNNDGLIPDDFFLSSEDAPDQHHLVNLTSLRIVSVAAELPRITGVDEHYFRAMADYDRSLQDQGLDTSQYHRLPPNLTSLTTYAKQSSSKWSEAVFAGLPRKLTELSIFQSGMIGFEDDGACLHALPPNLTSLVFGGTVHQEIEVPEWFYWYLPESITRINREARVYETYEEEEAPKEEPNENLETQNEPELVE